MKKQVYLAAIMAIVAIVIFSADNFVYAKPKGRGPAAKKRSKDAKVNTKWEAQADKNQDGIATKKEKKDWKRATQDRIDVNDDGQITRSERRRAWLTKKAKVNNKHEMQYDANQDGWLQPDEIKTMLRAKHEKIAAKRRYQVDSPIEAEYDADNDGFINEQEAEALKEDLN